MHKLKLSTWHKRRWCAGYVPRAQRRALRSGLGRGGGRRGSDGDPIAQGLTAVATSCQR